MYLLEINSCENVMSPVGRVTNLIFLKYIIKKSKCRCYTYVVHKLQFREQIKLNELRSKA